jgi:coenzyme F430 synthetase
MDLSQKKLAVLDLTHGGIPIAKKLAALENDVTGVDVYGTVDSKILLELEKKHGIKYSKVSLPVSEFDFIVAPVHLDPAYPMLAEAGAEGKTIFSHHEIVGKILRDDPRLFGTKTIEVTGVKAKTSTSSLLADMLSRKFAVVLHTSRGLEAWKRGVSSLISRGLSITPGSILVAVEKVFEAGVKPDFFIFEISIGGTGTADLGILTTLYPDYGIANNTNLASEAKLQLVRNTKPGSTLLLNSGAEKALAAAKESPAKVLTFKDPFNTEFVEKSDNAADFTLETSCSNVSSPGYSGTVLHLIYRGNELFSTSLLSGYNDLAYRTAFTAASAAALELGVGCEAIVAVLEEFRGLSGRMQERELNGVALIDNSNSGMDILSAEKALEYALLKKRDEKKRGIILVLGEEASQVCEGLPPALVQGFVDKLGTKCRLIILVGERMKTVVFKNALYVNNLPEGLSIASELAEKDELIISSVKCFR